MTARIILAEIGEQTAWDPTGGSANVLVSPDGKTLSQTTGANTSQQHRKTKVPRNSGKLFAAARIVARPSTTAVVFGISTATHPLTGPGSGLGWSANSWGMIASGQRITSGAASVALIGPYVVGDYIVVAIDLETAPGFAGIWFGRATTLGGPVGWSSGDPAIGSSADFVVPTFDEIDGRKVLRQFYLAGSIRTNGGSIELSTSYDEWGARVDADLPGFQVWGEFGLFGTDDYCSTANDLPAHRFYSGRIAEGGAPVYVRTMSVFPWQSSAGHAPAFGGFTLHNDDGAFDALLGASVRGMPGRFLVGDPNGGTAAMTVAGTFNLDRIDPEGEKGLRFVCGDKLSVMKRTVNPEVYDGTLPNATLAGQVKPFLAGVVKFAPLIPIDPANLEYQLADEMFVGGPSALYDAGVAISGGAVGWTFGARADNFGVRRLTNPNGKQVVDVTGRINPRGAAWLDTPFTAWTSDNPTGWVISSGTETATRRFTNPGGGGVRAQSDGTGLLALRYNTSTPLGTYTYEVTVGSFTTGRVLLRHGLTVIGVLNRAGTFRGTFAGSSNFLELVIEFGTTVDLVVSSMKVWPETAANFRDWMVNLAVNRGGLLLADLNTADLDAIAATAPALGIYARDGELVTDVMRRSLDAVLGFMWQDRLGQVRFRTLLPPDPAGKSPAWLFDDLVLSPNDIQADPDLAPGMPPSVSGRRNYGMHRDAEIAGGVFAGNPTLVGQLLAEYLTNERLYGLHPAYAADARARPAFGTLISDGSGLASLAAAIVAAWRRFRRFWRFEVEIEDGAHLVEIGDECQLYLDPSRCKPRFDLDKTEPGASLPGRRLVIVGAETALDTSLVRITAWG